MSLKASFGSCEDKCDAPSDGRRERQSVLVFLNFACLLQGADLNLLPASFRALEEELSLSPSWLAGLGFCQMLTQATSAPLWGCLADSGVPRRWLLAGGVFGWGFLTFGLCATSSYPIMVVLRLLNGVALGVLVPVQQSLIADVTEPSERGKIFGIAQWVTGLGRVMATVGTTAVAARSLGGIDGWRVSFAVVAVLSLGLAMVTFFFMREPLRPWTLGEASLMGELRSFADFWSINTFKIIVIQGIFGCVPVAALDFLTMYFQYMGIWDIGAAALSSTWLLATGVGNVIGGYVGDYLAKLTPTHGRPLTAQISVISGIPICWMLFKYGTPETTFKAWFVAMLVLGLLSSWCNTGVNSPILSEIVASKYRARIAAWLSALSMTSAAAFGGPGVGFISEKAYGFKASRDDVSAMPPDVRNANASALGGALFWCTVLPWVLCLMVFSLLHFTYKADLTAAERQERGGGTNADEEGLDERKPLVPEVRGRPRPMGRLRFALHLVRNRGRLPSAAAAA